MGTLLCSLLFSSVLLRHLVLGCCESSSQLTFVKSFPCICRFVYFGHDLKCFASMNEFLCLSATSLASCMSSCRSVWQSSQPWSKSVMLRPWLFAFPILKEFTLSKTCSCESMHFPSFACLYLLVVYQKRCHGQQILAKGDMCQEVTTTSPTSKTTFVVHAFV